MDPLRNFSELQICDWNKHALPTPMAAQGDTLAVCKYTALQAKYNTESPRHKLNLSVTGICFQAD